MAVHSRWKAAVKYIVILVIAFIFGAVVAVVQFYTEQSDCESNTAFDQTEIKC